MVGKEVFASDEALAEAAELNARDVSILNQEACVCSRFTFLEANAEDGDRYAKVLAERLRIDRMGEGEPRPLDMELKEQIDVLRMMDDDYGVFGKSRRARRGDPFGRAGRFPPAAQDQQCRLRARSDGGDEICERRDADGRRLSVQPHAATCAITLPAAVPSASCGSARPAPAPSATRTTRCIRCTGLSTGWPMRMAARGIDRSSSRHNSLQFRDSGIILNRVANIRQRH